MSMISHKCCPLMYGFIVIERYLLVSHSQTAFSIFIHSGRKRVWFIDFCAIESMNFGKKEVLNEQHL